ncbi:MAG: AraC family transcriptional regulator [Clostridia bacterium]|nr:AraC family transcriptional regulator [Clostridia bacterium]
MTKKLKTIHNYTFSTWRDRNIRVFVRSTGEFILNGIDYSAMHKEANFAELFWVQEGVGIFQRDGKRYRVPAQHVWYYPSGAEHFHYVWLTLQGDDPDYFFRTLAIPPGKSAAGECPAALFQKLAIELSGKQAIDSLLSLMTAFQILTRAALPQNNRKKDFLENIKAVIEDDYANAQMSVSHLAEIFRVHRCVLSRSFSRRYHTTLRQYIQKCRITAAQNLLKKTNLALSQIATQCGFSSAEYFSRVFLQTNGVPPGKYRREILNGKE